MLKKIKMKIKDNSYRTLLKSAEWIIVALVCFIITLFLDDKKLSNIWCKSFESLLLTLIPVFLVSGAWEGLTKRSFANEVLNMAGISDNLIKSGIIHYYENFSDIEWKKEFKNVKKVKIFFSYGYSWRNNNRAVLQELIKQGGELTVILPNYENKDICDELDRSFKYGKFSDALQISSTKDKIIESKIFFEKIGAKVLLYDNTIRSTYYLYDDKCIFAPFKHGTEKLSVPAFKGIKGGTFYEFCNREINSIINLSSERMQIE